jgi:phenylpropionate dioxygenase-like ring-hydroxylating dioxygenase large terminal subunit
VQRHNQLELGREIVKRLDERSTPLTEEIFFNDPSIYTDVDRFARERELFFHTYPLVIGASCRIPEAGDFFTDEYTDLPLLVVRGDDGRARVLANACRHRGAKVELREGGAGARVFTCPYHGWTYGRGGELRAVPHAADYGPVDLACNGLVELPSVERAGLIFARPQRASDLDLGPALDRLLGPELGPDLEAYGLADFHHFETRTLTRRLNWKLCLDTFHESYHFKSLHRDSIFPLLHSNLAPVRTYGPNHLLAAVRRTATELADQPEEDWDVIAHTALVYLLFPNTIFIMQKDHIELFRIFPTDSVSECTLEVSLYTPEPAATDSARRYWTKNFDLLLRTADVEDFANGATIQRAFEAGILDRVSYGRNEPLLHNFHRALREAMGETVPAAGPARNAITMATTRR